MLLVVTGCQGGAASAPVAVPMTLTPYPSPTAPATAIPQTLTPSPSAYGTLRSPTRGEGGQTPTATVAPMLLTPGPSAYGTLRSPTRGEGSRTPTATVVPMSLTPNPSSTRGEGSQTPTVTVAPQTLTPNPSPTRGEGSRMPTATVLPPAASQGQAAPKVVEFGRPVRLRIPKIGVNAVIEAVGLDETGAMANPSRWENTAWYSLGGRPGGIGNAVISGHLDSTTGPAVFWRLAELRPGDRLSVTDEAGRVLEYEVETSEVYPYDKAPLQQIFGNNFRSRLNLITCRGTFDTSSKNYNQRLVVYTRPVG